MAGAVYDSSCLCLFEWIRLLFCPVLTGVCQLFFSLCCSLMPLTTVHTLCVCYAVSGFSGEFWASKQTPVVPECCSFGLFGNAEELQPWIFCFTVREKKAMPNRTDKMIKPIKKKKGKTTFGRSDSKKNRSPGSSWQPF